MKGRITTSVTSNCQITIPKWAVAKLGLTPGDEIEISATDASEFVSKVRKAAGRP